MAQPIQKKQQTTAIPAATDMTALPAVIAMNEGLETARSLAIAAESKDDRLGFARAMAFAAIKAYLKAAPKTGAERWTVPDLPKIISMAQLSPADSALADNIGTAAATLDVMEANYWLGVLYTTSMPEKDRAGLGAYYTPPVLCERLLDLASAAGIDWRTARVLDPACGGGAFLTPVALRMLRSLDDCSPKIALKNILHRLRGFELDPFAAWMSRVFLENALYDFCRAADTQLPDIVEVCDTLERNCHDDGFDLVIGNPPYGRTTLSPDKREKYRRSLYGHANLYGLFTDLALRFTRPGGVIAYVTPTSFLSGEYFKSLRGLLGREAPPASIDFIPERKGVFADVLQETLLAVYRRDGKARIGQVNFISQPAKGRVTVTSAGSFALPARPEEAWLVPRTRTHDKLVRNAQRMPHRLVDYGYRVSTGPLVWNRHKSGLKSRPARQRYPLIWAESVRPDGTFEFRAHKRNHMPYFEPLPSETWVLTNFPCVLLQRTTAKEQTRRLIAAEMPSSFVASHGAVVVENHLNMIRPIDETPPLVSRRALSALLNTAVVDELFRCINGSVAVSAYELEALPLPSPQDMAAIEALVERRKDRTAVELAAWRLYGGKAG
ncbi:class I SAM-dependent DNA methyltransferase [Taklimakanibacter lacteus]|uniref:class I SAM-dependent DNA methyltransferase n=1 Tax=Taklimakanibacter lacteus TaxID=2268456 RepID=UPI0034D7877B